MIRLETVHFEPVMNANWQHHYQGGTATGGQSIVASYDMLRRQFHYSSSVNAWKPRTTDSHAVS